MANRFQGGPGVLLYALLCALCGCGRGDPGGALAAVPPAIEPGHRPAFPAPLDAVEERERVDLVRSGPCGPDGAGYAGWVEQLVAAREGALLFSDWTAMRKEAGTDEVRFVYTCLDRREHPTTRIVSWEVRRADGHVGPPRLDPPAPGAGKPDGGASR